MKNFWGSFFGSIVGIVVTGVICTIIFIIGLAAIFSSAFKNDSAKDKIKISDNTVLHLKLDYPVGDRTDYNPFASGFNLDNMDGRTGLDDIIATLKYAQADKRIKGIYMELGSIPSGMATLEEIRAALSEFRKSGKFIYTYSEGLSQKGYYMASVSDETYLHPIGSIDFKGLGAELMFFKNTLDKLGLEPVIIRPTGNRFKSAVEPFFLDKASEANRLQLQVLLHSMWDKIVGDISQDTKLSVDSLNHIADTYGAYNAMSALSHGMIKGMMYEDEMLAYLKEKAGVKPEEDLNLVSFDKYFKKVNRSLQKRSKNKIAVVYASGDIVSGKGDNGEIGSETFVKALREARLDEDIKAVVLRVNSPGGDAIASEMIWREVVLTEKVKPIVVSMGNYAASGGYYISCAADTIVADNTTLTGSIGVFSVLFNTQKFLNEKIGITFDTVKTHRMADFPNLTRSFTEEERGIFQRQVDDIYSLFLSHVSEGRNLTVAQVDSIAQGRVWTGSDAIRLGLVDVIGGFEKAVTIAAGMAKLEDYELVQLPEDDSPFSKFFRDLSSETTVNVIKEQVGEENYRYVEHLKKAKGMKGVQARLPFTAEIY